MSFLINVYYGICRLLYRRVIAEIGTKTEIRFGSILYHGEKVHIGKECQIGKGLVCAVYTEYGGEDTPANICADRGVFIGDKVTANRNLTIYCAEKIEIGAGTMMGSYILITDNNHGTNAGLEANYREQALTTKRITIGENCWIAEKCSILAGTIIGNRCIIAANSVVTGGTYPDKCILAGNPARIIRIWNDENGEWMKNSSAEKV